MCIRDSLKSIKQLTIDENLFHNRKEGLQLLQRLVNEITNLNAIEILDIKDSALFGLCSETVSYTHLDVYKRQAGKFPDEQKEKLAQVEESQAFLVWLCSSIKHHLAPGTLYQANVTSLKLLHILIKSGIDKSTPQQFLDNQNKREYPFSLPILQDVTFLRLLIDLLVSNYADVRELSKKMLFMMISADESRSLLDRLNINALRRTANSLLNNYEKGDAGAAVYEFIFTIMGSQRSFIDQTIDILSRMVQDLQNDSIGCAENSVGTHFAALSLVLNKFNSEKNHRDTSKTISKTINLVLKGWEATRNVVCHDSALGILPEVYACLLYTSRCV